MEKADFEQLRQTIKEGFELLAETINRNFNLLLEKIESLKSLQIPSGEYHEIQPPPIFPGEISPSLQEVRKGAKVVLGFILKRAEELKKDPKDLKEEEIESLLKELEPSFPRQVAYFRIWKKRVKDWKTRWKEFAEGE
jgi:hypothetical protein